jgi:hypothetical protein
MEMPKLFLIRQTLLKFKIDYRSNPHIQNKLKLWIIMCEKVSWLFALLDMENSVNFILNWQSDKIDKIKQVNIVNGSKFVS